MWFSECPARTANNGCGAGRAEWAKGIRDNQGRETSPITDTRSKYERGRDILAEISGTPADAPKANYAVLAPEIEVFLKGHLFAELFERDVLTYAERELATVAIIASFGQRRGTDAERAHGFALNGRNIGRITRCAGYH